jgi:hypothetical protein
LVVPHPPTKREDIQNQGIRDSEIPPEDYYPEGYHPELLTEWPVEGDLVVPLEVAPPDMTRGMGEAWRARQAYEEEMKKRDGE